MEMKQIIQKIPVCQERIVRKEAKVAAMKTLWVHTNSSTDIYDKLVNSRTLWIGM